MPADTKKDAHSMLEKAIEENSSVNPGKLQSFYYAYKEPSLWWNVILFINMFDGGGGDKPKTRHFYIGLTESHLVLQRFRDPMEPHGPPVIAEYDTINYKGQLNMYPGIKYFLKISGKRYVLHVPDEIDDWGNCDEDFRRFTSMIDIKLRQ